MPRYFFHVTNDDRSARDVDGVELLDFSAADREAREMARDLLTGSVVTRPEWVGWRIEVRDENGNQVLSFPALQD